MNLPAKIYKAQGISILIAVLLTIQLAGCTASTELSTEFPTGSFDCMECQGFTLKLSDDGTLVVYMRGIEFITGKWYVESDVFYTGDRFCHDEDAMPASYRWRFDGEILTFRVTEDECSDRISSLDGKPWKLIEEK